MTWVIVPPIVLVDGNDVHELRLRRIEGERRWRVSLEGRVSRSGKVGEGRRRRRVAVEGREIERKDKEEVVGGRERE